MEHKDNYKELNTELLQLRADTLNKKCPINNFKQCDIKCASYDEGHLYKVIQTFHKMVEPGCRNAQVTGEIHKIED